MPVYKRESEYICRPFIDLLVMLVKVKCYRFVIFGYRQASKIQSNEKIFNYLHISIPLSFFV